MDVSLKPRRACDRDIS